MSLQLLAKQMEAKGRKGDSMLVHMTPEEVAGLQKLAESAGGSLTVNPETGLVEANFLKRMLPTLVGMGVGFATMNPFAGAAAGAAVGGVQAKENNQDVLLGAGLGALGGYGGAGLGAGISQAGATVAAEQAAAETGKNVLAEQAQQQLIADQAAKATLENAGQRAIEEQLAQEAGQQVASTGAENLLTTQTDAAARQAFLEQQSLDQTNQIVGSYDAAKKQFLEQSLADKTGQGFQALGEQGGRDAFMSEVGGGMGLAKSGASMYGAYSMTPEKIDEEGVPVDDEMYEYDYDVGRTYAENTPGSGSGERLYFDGKYSAPRKIRARDYQYADGGIAGLMSKAKSARDTRDARNAERQASRDAKDAERQLKLDSREAEKQAAREAYAAKLGLDTVPNTIVEANNLAKQNAIAAAQAKRDAAAGITPAPVAGLPALANPSPAPAAGLPALGGAPFSTPSVNLTGPTGALTSGPGQLPTFTQAKPAAQTMQSSGTGASGAAMDYLMGRTSSSAPKTPVRAVAPTNSNWSNTDKMYSFNPVMGTFTKNVMYVAPEDAARAAKEAANAANSVMYQDNSGIYSGHGGGEGGNAAGGLLSLAKGGMKSGGFVIPADVVSMVGEGNTDAGYSRIKSMVPGATAIKGKDGGQADTVKTSIEGKQPARVAHGEMYIPPETVKRMGGAKKLYAMMDRVRAQATGSKKQIKPVNLKRALA